MVVALDGHTPTYASTQTAPLIAEQSASLVQSLQIASVRDTQTVSVPVTVLAQNPDALSQIPIFPYALAVTPGMQVVVRLAQKLRGASAMHSQFAGQTQSIDPPQPSEPDPQSSRLSGIPVGQVNGVQHCSSPMQTPAQHAPSQHTDIPMTQQSDPQAVLPTGQTQAVPFHLC